MKHALAFGLPVFCWPALALAQSTPQAGLDPDPPIPPGVHLVDDTEPQPPLVPRSKDLLSRHFLAGASVGPAWSLGKLGSNVTTVHNLAAGLLLQGDLGFGLSRSMVLGVWGNYARYSDGDTCASPANPTPDCSAYSFSVGPFVRYHLSQGLRFDPWVLLGGGYRRMRFNQDTQSPLADPYVTETQTYSGLNWLRLELGGDYYAWSGVGLGPFGALSLSSYTDRPEGAGDASVNTELSLGLRLLLDLPGR
ncbi:MAG TPA: autotransporter outer membrane beta-barrel domain-containing protein [Polyangiaceae bacterium]|nr:autotransporter outer membrane beta-barrel domain-containing protein [Polyangiaceae bacterium]